MEPTTPARPSRPLLLAVLLLSLAGTLAVCREYAWRWRDAEAVARSFAAAALARDDAALARLGTADADAVLELEPGDARRCLGKLRFIEGRRRGEDTALLLFDGPDACPLGYRPALFLMQRTGVGWRVRDVGFFGVQRDGRVAAIDIPTV